MKKIMIATLVSMSALSCTLNPVGEVIADNNDVDDLNIGLSNLDHTSGTYNYVYACTADTNELSLGGTLWNGSLALTITD